MKIKFLQKIGEAIDKNSAPKLSTKEKCLLEGIDESVDFINKYDKKNSTKNV